MDALKLPPFFCWFNLNDAKYIISRDKRSDECIKPPSTNASTVFLASSILGPRNLSVGVVLYSNIALAYVDLDTSRAIISATAFRSNGVKCLECSRLGETQLTEPSALVFLYPYKVQNFIVLVSSLTALTAPYLANIGKPVWNTLSG